MQEDHEFKASLGYQQDPVSKTENNNCNNNMKKHTGG
jgi:hypothetical protein